MGLRGMLTGKGTSKVTVDEIVLCAIVLLIPFFAAYRSPSPNPQEVMQAYTTTFTRTITVTSGQTTVGTGTIFYGELWITQTVTITSPSTYTSTQIVLSGGGAKTETFTITFSSLATLQEIVVTTVSDSTMPPLNPFEHAKTQLVYLARMLGIPDELWWLPPTILLALCVLWLKWR